MKKILITLTTLILLIQQAHAYEKGDYVCVRMWSGTGYCGNIEKVTSAKYKILISSVSCGGFVGRCNPDSCNGGRFVARVPQGNEAGAGDVVWAEKNCVSK